MQSINEQLKNLNKLAKISATTEINFRNVTRHIPTGSQVITKLQNKTLNVKFIVPTSAPPLTTKDISRIEKRLNDDVLSFINDLRKEMEISDFSHHPYVFMEAMNKTIAFIAEFSISVKTKDGVKNLKKLDSDKQMEFHKSKKVLK